MKTLLAVLSLTLTLLPSPAAAQQLIAWPVGTRPWLHLLPGRPVRPMPLPRPTPRPGPVTPPDTTPVTVSGYMVEGEIRDQAADLTYRITFHNPTGQRLEGVLLVPIPGDAALSGFTMTVGGKEMKGELLESGQAATIYENIVRQARDPGLLELVGERLFRARVFPIEPNADVQVRLTLTQVLHKNGGLASITVPVRSARMLAGTRGAGGGASVRLNLRTTRPLRTVYSPEGRLAIARSGDRAATATLSSGTEEDATLFFSTDDDPLSASVLAYKEAGEDGAFMVSLSPRAHEGPDAPAALPKDLVFIVDRSGSMEEGGKMEQARKALAHCIKRLSPRDRFGVVDFATDWNALDAKLLFATEENKARALRYVERIEASGGTNIQAGLEQGLKLLEDSRGRVPIVFFMTDGLPTVGQTDTAALMRAAQEKNAALKARLFSFGVGSDVNTLFLDKLAQDNRGAGDYVQPGEDIEAKVSGLYQKVARPALTDVELSWEGVDVVQVYPRRVRDLFHGSELVVLGRYKSGGKGRLVVTGKAGARAQRFEFPVELPREDARHAFLPKLWASARVSHELDAIRLSGHADQEVINDIVKLAKKYGIVTPYTSYLITEDGADVDRARRFTLQAARGAAQDAMLSGASAGRGLSMRAQKTSRLFNAMNAAPAAPAAASEVMLKAEAETREELRASGARTVDLKTVAGKTFYKRGDAWVDGDFELSGAAAKIVELEYLGETYFETLRAHPELGRWFAVGAPLTVLHGGVAYRVR